MIDIETAEEVRLYKAINSLRYSGEGFGLSTHIEDMSRKKDQYSGTQVNEMIPADHWKSLDNIPDEVEGLINRNCKDGKTAERCRSYLREGGYAREEVEDQLKKWREDEAMSLWEDENESSGLPIPGIAWNSLDQVNKVLAPIGGKVSLPTKKKNSNPLKRKTTALRTDPYLVEANTTTPNKKKKTTTTTQLSEAVNADKIEKPTKKRVNYCRCKDGTPDYLVIRDGVHFNCGKPRNTNPKKKKTVVPSEKELQAEKRKKEDALTREKLAEVSAVLYDDGTVHDYYNPEVILTATDLNERKDRKAERENKDHQPRLFDEESDSEDEKSQIGRDGPGADMHPRPTTYVAPHERPEYLDEVRQEEEEKAEFLWEKQQEEKEKSREKTEAELRLNSSMSLCVGINMMTKDVFSDAKPNLRQLLQKVADDPVNLHLFLEEMNRYVGFLVRENKPFIMKVRSDVARDVSMKKKKIDPCVTLKYFSEKGLRAQMADIFAFKKVLPDSEEADEARKNKKKIPKEVKIDAFTTWFYQPGKITYHDTFFDPSGRQIQGYINEFSGFKWSAYECISAASCDSRISYPCEKYKEDPVHSILDHIFYVLADENVAVYDQILGWLYHMVNNPNYRTEVMIGLEASQGSGKSSFFEHLGVYWGKHFVPVNTQHRLTGKFDLRELRQAVLILIEEISGKKKTGLTDEEKKTFMEAMKTFTTSNTRQSEHKGMDTDTVSNFSNVIACTNTKNWLISQPGERRTIPVTSSKRVANNKAYFKWIYDQVMKADGHWGVKRFIGYLMLTYPGLEDNKFQPGQNIPTEASERMKNNSMDPVNQALIDCCHKIIGNMASQIPQPNAFDPIQPIAFCNYVTQDITVSDLKETLNSLKHVKSGLRLFAYQVGAYWWPGNPMDVLEAINSTVGLASLRTYLQVERDSGRWDSPLPIEEGDQVQPADKNPRIFPGRTFSYFYTV